MNAVLWKELRDSRHVTIGLLILMVLGGAFEIHDREMHWILMRVLLLPVAVGILGARLMGAESEEERIHLLTLPLPSPGIFGIRLLASFTQAAILVAVWFWIESASHPARALTTNGMAVVVSAYAFLFAFSAWLSLITGSLASSCSLSFCGSVLVYFATCFFGPPYYRHGTGTLVVAFGAAALVLSGFLIWVCRQDGFDEGPRRRVFWLGMALMVFAVTASILGMRL